MTTTTTTTTISLDLDGDDGDDDDGDDGDDDGDVGAPDDLFLLARVPVFSTSVHHRLRLLLPLLLLLPLRRCHQRYVRRCVCHRRCC